MYTCIEFIYIFIEQYVKYFLRIFHILYTVFCYYAFTIRVCDSDFVEFGRLHESAKYNIMILSEFVCNN